MKRGSPVGSLPRKEQLGSLIGGPLASRRQDDTHKLMHGLADGGSVAVAALPVVLAVQVAVALVGLERRHAEDLLQVEPGPLLVGGSFDVPDQAAVVLHELHQSHLLGTDELIPIRGGTDRLQVGPATAAAAANPDC